ncbi:diguanylate cyclase [Aquabacterium sp.]|uniref:diguanylate cyclase n=1 Tax=Aquabacterium sp. TaxID=1872578 RepID=UPI0019827EC3|nr:diguanylate cyclase [Aquabacterium sp.]MBC7701399.1 GGDEF domain-containing protein [Aquabacterium sp.]
MKYLPEFTPSDLLGAQAHYLIAWAVLITAVVVCVTAMIRCNTLWLHRWLSLGWLSDVLFTRDIKQKKIGLRYMVGVVNCTTGLVALNYGASVGVIDPDGCRQLTWAAVLIMGTFYGLLRTGWNRKLANPSMSEAQMAAAIGFLGWGYLIGGPGAPVALMLLFIILMFGMFTATSRQLIRSSVLAGIVFATVFLMTAMRESAAPITVQLQMVYGGVLVIMLVSVCLLVNEMARLRARLTQRKSDLTAALAQIKELAIRDELTGLFNRRHMVSVLNAEGQRTDRSQGRFCLGLIDVDHFKKINDEWGHGTGDEVLRSLSNVIAAGLRETDVVARWGGEEFLVLFTETDCEDATVVIERIRLMLSNTVVSSNLPELRVTFSAGMTTYQVDESIVATIERADQALYQAKATGRNRTERHTFCDGDYLA